MLGTSCSRWAIHHASCPGDNKRKRASGSDPFRSAISKKKKRLSALLSLLPRALCCVPCPCFAHSPSIVIGSNVLETFRDRSRGEESAQEQRRARPFPPRSRPEAKKKLPRGRKAGGDGGGERKSGPPLAPSFILSTPTPPPLLPPPRALSTHPNPALSP